MQEDADKQFQILRVFQDGSFFAKRCTSMIGKDFCSGPVVLMPSGTDPLPYDQKMIHLKNPQVVDTHTYTDGLGIMRTIAVIVDRKE